MDYFGARDNLYLQENLMVFQGIVITGTSGSGKSAIARKLCETDTRFQIVRAVTTRAKRDDDLPGTYEYISLLLNIEANSMLLSIVTLRL
jgi:serine kinase of HPr protein (carbohydrate metabolism regulator)